MGIAKGLCHFSKSLDWINFNFYCKVGLGLLFVRFWGLLFMLLSFYGYWWEIFFNISLFGCLWFAITCRLLVVQNTYCGWNLRCLRREMVNGIKGENSETFLSFSLLPQVHLEEIYWLCKCSVNSVTSRVTINLWSDWEMNRKTRFISGIFAPASHKALAFKCVRNLNILIYSRPLCSWQET